MKPICVKCQRFYRQEKNGTAFVESMPKHNEGKRVAPGTATPELWQPYKLWMGDLWKCDGCGSLIIVGVGTRQLSEHYKPDFEQTCKEYGATIVVNDC